MPVDISSSASFSDLIRRLAERSGHASQTGSVSAVPVDAHNLDLMKRYVNEGYDRFLRASKDWTFLDLRYELTLDEDGESDTNVEGDPARYRLPSYIAGAPKGPWRYNDQRTARVFVQNVARAQVEGYMQIGQPTLGPPTVAAYRPLVTGDPIGGQSRGWEVLFWPVPDQPYVLAADFRVKQHKLVDLAERHIAGQEHDAAIIAFAWMVWQEDDAENPADLARAREAVYGIPGTAMRGALAESIDLDRKNFPDTVGDNTGEGYAVARCRLPRIASVDGVPVEYDL